MSPGSPGFITRCTAKTKAETWKILVKWMKYFLVFLSKLHELRLDYIAACIISCFHDVYSRFAHHEGSQCTPPVQTSWLSFPCVWNRLPTTFTLTQSKSEELQTPEDVSSPSKAATVHLPSFGTGPWGPKGCMVQSRFADLCMCSLVSGLPGAMLLKAQNTNRFPDKDTTA